jgi:hypothetical protein
MHMQDSRRRIKEHMEILPASLLGRRAAWRMIAAALPRQACLMVIDPRQKEQAERSIVLGDWFRRKGLAVFLVAVKPRQAPRLQPLPASQRRAVSPHRSRTETT